MSGRVLEGGAHLDAATAVVILLHGRGGSAEEMLGLGEVLVAGLKGAERWCVLAPQAEGSTWYPQSFLAAREENEPKLSQGLATVEALVEAAGQAVGTQRVVLGGFSQGACLSSEFAAGSGGRVAGVIAWTGGLIGPPEMEMAQRWGGGSGSELSGVEVYLSSSDPDPHVPWGRVEQTAAVLQQKGAAVRLERFPGKPHNVSGPEIAAARELLGRVLGR